MTSAMESAIACAAATASEKERSGLLTSSETSPKTASIHIEKLNIRIHTLDGTKSLEFSCPCLALRQPSTSKSTAERSSFWSPPDIMSTDAGLSKVFELRGLCMSEQPALVNEVAQRLREYFSNKQTEMKRVHVHNAWNKLSVTSGVVEMKEMHASPSLVRFLSARGLGTPQSQILCLASLTM